MATFVVTMFLLVGSFTVTEAAPKTSARAQDIDNVGNEDLFRPGVCNADLGEKKFLSNDICGVTCTFDLDCPKPQKCCPNICGGTMCSDPHVEDPCASVTCDGQGEICRVNDLGQAVCECYSDCPQVYQPVCGSDGKHYDNRCKLDYKACRKNRPIFEAECPEKPMEDVFAMEEMPTTKKIDRPGPAREDTKFGSQTRDTMVTTDMAAMTTDQVTTTTPPVTTEDITEEPAELQFTIPLFQVITVNEGDDARLFCDAISRTQPPTYLWLYNRGALPNVLSPGHQKHGVAVSDDGHYLTISAVSDTELGIYTCMLKTTGNFITARYQLQFPVTTVMSDVTSEQSQTTKQPDGNKAGLIPSNQGKPHLPREDRLPTNGEICSLPMDSGNCFRRDAFPHWYYDLATQQCRPFTYSGCGGNDNRFLTYAECLSACPELPSNPCKHPIVTGSCRAHFVRWGYDETTRECTQFVYGGCLANGNNFETQEECDATCLDKDEKKETCLCVEPNFVDSFCTSQFVLTGHVKQKMLSPGFGALLVVEVEEMIVRGNLTMTNVPYLNGPLVVIRDVAQDACQCHDAKADGKLYIFMGYMTEDGYAQVDDTSFVKSSSEKRLAKLNNLKEKKERRCS